MQRMAAGSGNKTREQALSEASTRQTRLIEAQRHELEGYVALVHELKRRLLSASLVGITDELERLHSDIAEMQADIRSIRWYVTRLHHAAVTGTPAQGELEGPEPSEIATLRSA